MQLRPGWVSEVGRHNAAVALAAYRNRRHAASQLRREQAEQAAAAREGMQQLAGCGREVPEDLALVERTHCCINYVREF